MAEKRHFGNCRNVRQHSYERRVIIYDNVMVKKMKNGFMKFVYSIFDMVRNKLIRISRSLYESKALIYMGLFYSIIYIPHLLNISVAKYASYMGAVYMYAVLFLRILNRGKKLRELDFFEIDDFSNDRRSRAEYLLDCCNLFAMIVLQISISNKINEELGFSILALGLYIYLILAIMYSSVKSTKLMPLLLAIFNTSLVGLTVSISFIFGVVYLFLRVGNDLIHFVTGKYLFIETLINQYRNVSFHEFIFSITPYWKEILIIQLLSIVFQLIFTFVYPAYGIGKLAIAFKCISIALVILSMSFIYSQVDTEYEINIMKEELLNNVDFDDAKLIESDNFKEELEILSNYNSKKFDNLISLITMPYTIGSLICLFIIEVIRYRNDCKADELVVELVSNRWKMDSSEEYILAKQILYFGGKKYMKYTLL